MMLPIFPAQALDSSVLTTVWIGLCVITFLNLRFGTTVAGLVVPGYLVPLLLVKPTSVAVIWVEAIVTYLLARLLADYLMRRTGSCTMFGRDRFFALLLISVLVRTVFDGFLLPWAGGLMAANGVAFDYHNNLYSFGLVIIALTANQMWNAGMTRGLGVFVLYVGLTFAIVRGVLIPYTNFDIAGLGFLYEGLATDILASPKAYLILLSTAFIASRMNLIYGWEFSGILIPALLALQWFQPTKLVISLVEAGIIFSVGHAALRLPMFRRMNMEGSRLLLLFFTCGYLYKLALGFALERFAPSVKATDYFAFGYLLSTLIAVKMHQKQITWQITRTTVQTSLMGLALASVAGYALVVLLPPHAASAAAQTSVLQTQDTSNTTLAQALADRKRSFYATDRSPIALRYPGTQLQEFGDGVRTLLRYRDDPRPALLASALQSLERGGFVVERARDWLVIRDRDTRRGSGLYAINLKPRDGLAVEVPAPIDEPGVFEAAAQLVQANGHATFASAGTRRDLQPDGRANVLRNAELPFGIFHAAAGAGGVLQVRGQTSGPDQDPPAQLWVQREMPAGVDPARLARLTGPVTTRFGRRPSVNPLRDASSAPLAELMLGRPARLRLIARALESDRATRIDEIQRVDGFLFAWLVQRRDAIASAGSGRYEKPELGDLLYLQAEVIEPLYALASTWQVRRDDDLLEAINAAASTLGYGLVLHRHVATGEEHVILTEQDGGTRHWGTYVLRMGEAAPYVIEIPRPLGERQTFRYGTRLFARLQARALLVPGAHFAVRADGAGNVLAARNPGTMFNLVHQVLVPAMGRAPWVLQVRGRRDEGTAPAPDVIAGFVGKPATRAERSRLDTVLLALRGDADTVALEGTGAGARSQDPGADTQADFVRRLSGPRFMTLRVSAQARRSERDTLGSDGDRGRYAAVGIATVALDLDTHLQSVRFALAPGIDIRRSIDDYVLTRNLAALASVRTAGTAVRRLVDLDSGRDYLELADANGRLMALRDLEQSNATGSTRTARSPADAVAFTAQGDAWLLGASP